MSRDSFVLKIQRELCHPKRFGPFEKQAPGPFQTIFNSLRASSPRADCEASHERLGAEVRKRVLYAPSLSRLASQSARGEVARRLDFQQKTFTILILSQLTKLLRPSLTNRIEMHKSPLIMFTTNHNRDQSILHSFEFETVTWLPLRILKRHSLTPAFPGLLSLGPSHSIEGNKLKKKKKNVTEQTTTKESM